MSDPSITRESWLQHNDPPTMLRHLPGWPKEGQLLFRGVSTALDRRHRLMMAGIFRLGHQRVANWDGAAQLQSAADRLDTEPFDWPVFSTWVTQITELPANPSETWVIPTSVLNCPPRSRNGWMVPVILLITPALVGGGTEGLFNSGMRAILWLMSDGPAPPPGWAEAAELVRDVFPLPQHPLQPWCRPEWRTDTVRALAHLAWAGREFSALPILADALEDAGCDDPEALAHCRAPASRHCRGCWVLDAILFSGAE